MRDVRLRFSKKGLLRFVSHLDLNRAMLRALRMSDIPIWYTEGFNPHPYATFALPLPLGAESENDVMDIRVVGDIKNAETAKRLNSVLPSGLEITDCYNPVGKVKEISAAEYLFFFEPDTDTADLSAFISAGELFCEKLGKSRGRKVIKTVNLLENVISYSVTSDENAVVLDITLPAGSVNNINPILLAEEMKKAKGFDFTLVRRTALLTENGLFK